MNHQSTKDTRKGRVQALLIGLIAGGLFTMTLAVWAYPRPPYDMAADEWAGLSAARQTLRANQYVSAFWQGKFPPLAVAGLIVGLILACWTYERVHPEAARTLHGLWDNLRRSKVGLAGFLGVMGFLVLMFIAPALTGEDLRGNPAIARQPPSAAHWLGTDHQGRDVWVQIVHGGRELVVTAVVASLIATAIAVSLGSLAALSGGVVDAALVALANFVLTVPRLPLLILIATLVRFDVLILLALVIGLLGWPGLLRAIRAQVLSLRERDYVEAARALDLGTAHIMLREILPNMMSYVLISFIFGITDAMYAQVALIFFGMVAWDSNNWGVMMGRANQIGAIFSPQTVWFMLAPIIAVALFQLSLVTFARSLEEVFNPRLRNG